MRDERRRLALRVSSGVAAGAWVVWRSWDASHLSDRSWAAAGTMLAMAAVTAVLPVVRRRLPAPGAVPALIGVMQFAIYACVPETDQIPRVALIVVALGAIELGSRHVVPWWVHGVVAAVVLWSGIFGATGRESALIGALFACWPIVLVALVPGNALVAAAVGSIAAVAVARTGALEPTPGPAVVAVAIALPVSALLALLGGLPFTRRRCASSRRWRVSRR
jgi:hypothetical protein